VCAGIGYAEWSSFCPLPNFSTTKKQKNALIVWKTYGNACYAGKMTSFSISDSWSVACMQMTPIYSKEFEMDVSVPPTGQLHIDLLFKQ